MDVYRAVAWLGWVPNIIAAELLIRTYHFRKPILKTPLLDRRGGSPGVFCRD